MLSQVQLVELFTDTASRIVCSIMQNAVTGTAGTIASNTCKCKMLSQVQLVELFAVDAKCCHRYS